MEKIKIGFTQNWQEAYIVGILKEQNKEQYFLGNKIANEVCLMSALQQGECDAIFINMSKLAIQLSGNLVITAVSERFLPQYELFIKKEKQVEMRLLDLAADACIFVEDNCLPYLLKEISSDFVFSDEKETSDAFVFPLFYVEKNNISSENEVRIALNPREFPPMAAQGVFAYVCNKNDTETRRFLKNLHHSEVAELTNIERSFVKLNEGKICAAYCERDKMDNFHLWVAVVQEDGTAVRARASTSTKVGLAEAAIKQVLENI